MGLKKRVKPKHIVLYADIDVAETTCGEPPDPDDPWARWNTRSEFCSVSVKRYLSDYSSEDDVSHDAGSSVFVLMEVVDTGDTFGRDDGRHYARGIFNTYDEALKYAETHPPTDGYFDSHVRWKVEHAVVEAGSWE